MPDNQSTALVGAEEKKGLFKGVSKNQTDQGRKSVGVNYARYGAADELAARFPFPVKLLDDLDEEDVNKMLGTEAALAQQLEYWRAYGPALQKSAEHLANIRGLKAESVVSLADAMKRISRDESKMGIEIAKAIGVVNVESTRHYQQVLLEDATASNKMASISTRLGHQIAYQQEDQKLAVELINEQAKKRQESLTELYDSRRKAKPSGLFSPKLPASSGA